jgi:hypothetical protein
VPLARRLEASTRAHYQLLCIGKKWQNGRLPEATPMNVRQLVETLQKLPDQEATVLIGEGVTPNVWLIVTGVVERHIARSEVNPDSVGPGKEAGIEIV